MMGSVMALGGSVVLVEALEKGRDFGLAGLLLRSGSSLGIMDVLCDEMVALLVHGLDKVELLLPLENKKVNGPLIFHTTIGAEHVCNYSSQFPL